MKILSTPMITIKTCTVCSLVATEDAIGHSCRSSDNRKVSRDPLSTKLGMQPDCIIHLLSFRNWRPTGSFWRMMVDGEFLISFLVCSFNQRDPFLSLFSCCWRFRERTFPQIVISAKTFLCICTIHTEKSTVYKILLRDWTTRVLQFQIHNAY